MKIEITSEISDSITVGSLKESLKYLTDEMAQIRLTGECSQGIFSWESEEELREIDKHIRHFNTVLQWYK